MIQYLYLGRVDYGEALRLQQELVALRTADRIGNVLLLLEHPPVLTLGRNANRSNILASDELLARRGVTLHEINRGGDVTYHGPGQLIGYPFSICAACETLAAPARRGGAIVSGPSISFVSWKKRSSVFAANSA
jgi:lipoate-protein ligase B